MEQVLICVATGCGLGDSRWLPGTVGALLGLPLVWLIAKTVLWKQFAIAVILCFLAGVVCESAEQRMTGADPRAIVADEYLTLPVAAIGLPVTRHPALLVLVFTVSRALDGIKPPPARLAERIPGGAGIVLDDIVTNIYALAIGLLANLSVFRRRAN